MKQICFAALYFIAILLLHSCANKVTPTGGIKDIQPPVLINASPQNYQVNFTGPRIVLTFNEYVQLKDVQKQVMISPPINPAPEITLRKKSIVITLPDSLKVNTTYTINFGDAISDFTESNSLPEFQFVFSTGNFVDSLIISGRLIDALTMKPVKEALALIYDSEIADSLAGTVPPLYYARSNENGSFTVRNVREGSYKLIGLVDNNSNLSADLPDEAIGSGSGFVLLKDSININAYLSKQLTATQNIKNSIRELPSKLVTVFERPVKNVSWKFLSIPPFKIISEISDYKDTVILYCFPEFTDSAKVVWYDNNIAIDTVSYRSEKSTSLTKTPAILKATGTYYPQQGGKLIPETQPFFRWSVPLKSFDFFRVKVSRDSVEFPVTGSFSDSIQIKTVFKGIWKEGTYDLIIPAGIAEDRFGRSNDTIRFSFTVPEDRTLGSISFDFTPESADSMLMQLVNDKDELVRQRKFSGKINGIFEQVEPGAYRLRMVYDLNNNNRWDAGEIRNNKAPEKVIYYDDPVTVRSNWEVEVEWAE